MKYVPIGASSWLSINPIIIIQLVGRLSFAFWDNSLTLIPLFDLYIDREIIRVLCLLSTTIMLLYFYGYLLSVLWRRKYSELYWHNKVTSLKSCCLDANSSCSAFAYNNLLMVSNIDLVKWKIGSINFSCFPPERYTNENNSPESKHDVPCHFVW